MKNLPLTEIKENHPDVFFVEFNLFNDYYVSLNNASNHYVEGLRSKLEKEK